jgi:hypothetical protein
MPFGWVGAAAAVVSAGTAVAGSLSKGGAQSSAIGAGQAQANQDLAPYADTGVLANTQQANLLGLNGQPLADQAMSSFQRSPGYDFQFKEGLRGIDAGAASTGILRSGATIKAEQAFGTGLADKDFGDYITRLNALSTTGANAATGQANVATGAAGAQSKIAGDETSGITNALTGLAGNTNVQNALRDYFQPSGSSIYGTPQTAPVGSTSGQAWAGTF